MWVSAPCPCGNRSKVTWVASRAAPFWTVHHQALFSGRNFGFKTVERPGTPQRFTLRITKRQIESRIPVSIAADQRRVAERSDWDVNGVLVVAEGLCIGLTAVSLTSTLLSSSTKPVVEAPVIAKGISTWQVLPLWGAILINAILRARQWQLSVRNGKRGREDIVSSDFTLAQRVMKLEEDIQNSLAIVQALSRQLEKLGVRFRVTRRTLRDPIQATAVLSQKTSEVVNALAQREDMLENELQEIQQVLLAMQDQQAKQLNLIAATVGKTLKGQRDFETKMERNLHRSGIGPSTRSVRTAQNLDSKNSRGSVVDEGNNVIQGLGDFGIGIIRKGAVKPNIERNASVGGKQTQDAGTSHRYESIQGKGPLNGASSTEVKSTRPKPEPSTRLSEPSLSKVDFWAEPIAPSAGLPSSLPLAQYSPTSSEKVDDAQSSASSSSNRLGTFFSSRKKMSGSQDPRASNY